jgi:NAD(P)-dependent dehydrogenase (short-subunit alcohol dehydrogenase family)
VADTLTNSSTRGELYRNPCNLSPSVEPFNCSPSYATGALLDAPFIIEEETRPQIAPHSAAAPNAWPDAMDIECYVKPSAVGRGCRVLARPGAAMVTGQVLAVDGGFSAGATVR